LRFGENLGCSEMRRGQFEFREIASAFSQIRAGVAKHVDQLKRHAVALAEGEHLVLAPPSKVVNMPETESRPKFTYTTGNEISVLIKIGSSAERVNFLRIVETLQIEHLAVRDVFEHHANIGAIRLLDLLKPIKEMRQ